MNHDIQVRLSFLSRVIRKEIKHLRYSEQRAFNQPFDVERARSLMVDETLAESVEAYTSRFCRLQDTLGDKLLPTWLTALGERTGAVIDNLDKAEKLGMLRSADEWLTIRQLRNQMIHEYVESPEILANALETAHRYQQELIAFGQSVLSDMENRGVLSAGQ